MSYCCKVTTSQTNDQGTEEQAKDLCFTSLHDLEKICKNETKRFNNDFETIDTVWLKHLLDGYKVWLLEVTNWKNFKLCKVLLIADNKTVTAFY